MLALSIALQDNIILMEANFCILSFLDYREGKMTKNSIQTTIIDVKFDEEFKSELAKY